MGKSKYVVSHHEAIEAMFEIKYGNNDTDDTDKWNSICDKFDNDAEGEYTLTDIEEELSDNPKNLMYQGLLKILQDDKKKSLYLTRN